MQKWFSLSIVWYNRFFSDLYDSFALFSDDNLSLLVITSRIFCNFKFFWYSFCKHLLNFFDSFIIVAVYFMFLCRALTWKALNDLMLFENISLRNQDRISDIKYVLSDLWKICRLKNWIYWKVWIKHKLNLSVNNIDKDVCFTIFQNCQVICIDNYLIFDNFYNILDFL